jgi:hypothetical protein
MTRLWQYDGDRRVFRVITAVWGTALLLEAALRFVIVFSTSAGTALAISKATPFLFLAILSAWTVAYGAHHKRRVSGWLPPPARSRRQAIGRMSLRGSSGTVRADAISTERHG